MPNPQVHVAVGMIGSFTLFLIAYFLFKKRLKRYSIIYFIPLIIILGSVISIIPDIPVLGVYYPSVFGPFDISLKDKTSWNTPFMNICFFHPELDKRYLEQYDTFGLILTILTFLIISSFLYYKMTYLTKKY